MWFLKPFLLTHTNSHWGQTIPGDKTCLDSTCSMTLVLYFDSYRHSLHLQLCPLSLKTFDIFQIDQCVEIWKIKKRSLQVSFPLFHVFYPYDSLMTFCLGNTIDKDDMQIQLRQCAYFPRAFLRWFLSLNYNHIEYSTRIHPVVSNTLPLFDSPNLQKLTFVLMMTICVISQRFPIGTK